MSPEATVKQYLTVQTEGNRHIHGQSTKVIHRGADASKPNIGLTAWDAGRLRKSDVAIAKDHLNQEEIGTSKGDQ